MEAMEEPGWEETTPATSWARRPLFTGGASRSAQFCGVCGRAEGPSPAAGGGGGFWPMSANRRSWSRRAGAAGRGGPDGTEDRSTAGRARMRAATTVFTVRAHSQAAAKSSARLAVHAYFLKKRSSIRYAGETLQQRTCHGWGVGRIMPHVTPSGDLRSLG